ncbi:MAG: hypothetical protein ACKORY_06250 [Actinomycetota bacterium]
MTDTALVARVVPDVTGIDRTFDYLVPSALVPAARPGSVVRMELNGRRVDGWIVATGPHGSPGFDEVPVDRLSALLDVAALGVAAEAVDLCSGVARRWSGPMRNVLRSATPERKRSRPVRARHGTAAAFDDEAARAFRALPASGGVLEVPPLVSALSVVHAAAAAGTVLVVCPTMRMARLGAASLRRRGLTTAELPGQVDAALAGVDVVIGARSAVLAGCAGLSSIVVIDEHEESFHEERVPTWWAPEVALERGRAAGVPVVLVSPCPSARAVMLHGEPVRVAPGSGWPGIEIVDLGDVPVGSSLLSGPLLEAVRESARSTLCVLNTKGAARMLVCASCRGLQTCPSCSAAESLDGDFLVCPSCAHSRVSACSDCGRTKMATVRTGTSRLRDELAANSRLPVREVTASTPDTGGEAQVYVGTEALLHRVSSAGSVVFLDVDRDLSAPRMTSGREVLASVARAARIVGQSGRIIIQTRQPGHPLLVALASGTTDEWRRSDTGTARSLGLAPFVSVAVIALPEGTVAPAITGHAAVQWTATEGGILARSADHDALLAFTNDVRSSADGRIRVAVNPPRV